MIDAIIPRQRLERLSANSWQSRLALCFIAAAIVLALSLEARASDMPPFVIGHPMCQTGFTIAMRYDERNSSGTIIKSVWVRKCVRVPRIVYGRKV